MGLAAASHILELGGGESQLRLCQLVHAVAMKAAFQHIGKQHGVIHRRHRDPVIGEHRLVVFEVMADLQDGGVFEQGSEQGQRLVVRNLVGHQPVLTAFAAALVLLPVLAIAEVEATLGRRCPVGERHVTSRAGFDGQRHPHQLGGHGVKRGGLGVHGHMTGLLRTGDPVQKCCLVAHQNIVTGRADSFVGSGAMRLFF